MMKTTTPTSLTLAHGALTISSGCIIIDDEYEYSSRSERTSSTTTTTTTTTTTNDRDVYDDRDDRDDRWDDGGNGGNGGWQEPVIPAFLPVMGSIATELIAQDYDWGTSWSFYDIHFTDVADTYACGLDMVELSEGSVAALRINGLEVDDEYAACPVGTYDIMPDCTLREGEACLELVWRDSAGRDAGVDYADFGWVDVTVEPGGFGEPHACHFSTRVDGDADLDFDYTIFFESWDLSPRDRNGEAICSL